MEVYAPKSGKIVCRQVPADDKTQTDLLPSLGVVLTTKIGRAGPNFAMLVKLSDRRKFHVIRLFSD